MVCVWAEFGTILMILQEIFTATMMGSLEWGLFDYAKGEHRQIYLP